jgi:hypothetical protein
MNREVIGGERERTQDVPFSGRFVFPAKSDGMEGALGFRRESSAVITSLQPFLVVHLTAPRFPRATSV